MLGHLTSQKYANVRVRYLSGDMVQRTELVAKFDSPSIEVVAAQWGSVGNLPTIGSMGGPATLDEFVRDCRKHESRTLLYPAKYPAPDLEPPKRLVRF